MINVHRLRDVLKRYYLRSWLLSGVALAFYGMFLTGCSAVVPSVPATPDKAQSVEEAELIIKAKTIETYGDIWEEESGDLGDSFSAGVSASKLANVTNDSAWSKAAIDSFSKDLKNGPADLAVTTAWLGSSHALVSRDFPIQGWWQIIPGPGFVRLYYVQRSFSLLEDAVEIDPFNPIVRLIRGSTYLGMPAIFGGKEDGLSDFALLKSWINNPELNSQYSDLVSSPYWQQEYYLSCAKSFSRIEKREESTKCWQGLFNVAQQPELKEYAKWNMN